MTEHKEEEDAAPPVEEDLDDALDALDLDTDILGDSYDEEDKKEEEEEEEEVGEEVDMDGPRSSKSLQAPESSKTVASNASSAHADNPAASAAAAVPEIVEDDDDDSWKDRLEIYSRHFKPNPKERAKLEAVAKKLDVKSMLKGGANIIDNMIGKGDDETDPHNTQSQWNRLVVGKLTKQTEKLPVSIILEQGPVVYKDSDGDRNHHGVQLILFTRGFLLAKREMKSAFGIFGKKEECLIPLGSALWTDVRQIQTTDNQTILLKCGGKNPKDQVHFEILPAQNAAQWKKDLQMAAIRAHQNFLTEDSHEELGWQYRLCNTPWFTEAVTGTRQTEQEEGHEIEISTSDSAAKSLDVLDDYNGMAPLHYATRSNHVEIMRVLLQAGADPNVEDKEGKTPMYFAEYYDLPHATIQLLQEFGATKSAKAEEEKRGELFGKVTEAENYRDEKRAAKKAQEEAEAAQSQMANNINAMKQRGEMIEELGDKANDLETGAQDYADMAATLKEKLKKKSKWGF